MVTTSSQTSEEHLYNIFVNVPNINSGINYKYKFVVFRWKHLGQTFVSPRRVWIHTLALYVAPSVPFGSLPPHVSLSLTVDGLVQLLVVLLHGVQVAQVAHAQSDGDQSKCHHWFILQ